MKSFKKTLLCILCCSVMVFNMFPPSAFAVDYDVVFPFAEPYVNENQGYIVYECKDADGNYRYYLYYITCFPVDYASESSNAPVSTPIFTVLAPNVSRDLSVFNVAVRMDSQYSYFAQGTFYYTSGQPFYQDPIYQSSGGLLVNISYGIPSAVTLTNYYCRGPWQTQGGVVPFDPTLKVGFNGDDSNYYSQLQEIITKLSTLHSDNVDVVNKFVEAINNLSTLHADNVEQLSKLAEVINLLVQNNSDNVQMLEKLAEILSDTSSIETITSNLLYTLRLYFPQFLDVLYYIDDELLTCIDKLNKIIDLLQPDTEVNVSKVDSSNFNEYNKAEQSLLDTSNVDVSGAMNVEINQQALLYIWPLLENCLNTNPKVIGLTFTILAISLVALILGRKGG